MCHEVVYLTTGNPAFYLALYLTRVHFRDELEHVGDVSEQKIKYRFAVLHILSNLTLKLSLLPIWKPIKT